MGITDNNFDVNLLISKIRNGDQQAFVDLFNKYKPMINNLISRFESDKLTKSFEEDLLQEATLVFYNAILTYDETQTEVEFGLYARICVSNALISQIRKLNKRRVEQPIELCGSDFCNEENISNPIDDIVSQEDLRYIYSVIKTNLSDYEYAIWHNYVMGKSVKEISLLINKNEKSVSNAIYRIRKKLRSLLK